MLKLNPKVAMMNSTISTTVMSGRWRRYFRPPSTPPRPLRPDGCSRDLSRRMRTVSVAANPRPLMRKTGPAPMRAVSTPATAGPIMRAPLKEAELRLTAFGSSFSPTSSETKAWRAGLSSVVSMPRVKAST